MVLDQLVELLHVQVEHCVALVVELARLEHLVPSLPSWKQLGSEVGDRPTLLRVRADGCDRRMKNLLVFRRLFELIVGDPHYCRESAGALRTTHLRARVEELQHPEVCGLPVIAPDLIIQDSGR